MEYVFGIHAVDGLLRHHPHSVRCLWVREGREDRRVAALLELARNQGIAVSHRSRQALDEMVSGRHQGVVAEVVEEPAGSERAGSNLWREETLLELAETRRAAGERPVLILVLDGVTDPHNLGACLRSADAAGVDAVVVPRDKSADLNATVRKVACGAAEAMPFVRVTNLARTLRALKERGVWLFGTAGEAARSLYENDLTLPMALVMGAEGSGLRRLTREQCDFLVSLPMAGSVGSLNVSVATGICLFEAVRQRGAGGLAAPGQTL